MSSVIGMRGSTVGFHVPTTKDQAFLQFLQENVKPEQVSPIMNACKRLFGETVQNPILLVGGRGTSKIIRFEVNNASYICRVTDAARPAFFIDTASEIHNMWAVNPLNVAPKLHYADVQTGVIIMDYVQPTRLTAHQLDNEEKGRQLYGELGRKVRALHSGPAFTKESTNIFKDLETTLKMANIDRAPDVAREVLQQVRSLAPLLNRHQVSVPSHKDLHSNNVLYDGVNAFFIDWELGANCDRFVDLACVSIFFIFDAEKDDDLLENYFGAKPTDAQRAQLFLMKQVCLCFYGIRLLRRVTGIGGLDLSKERMDPNNLPKFRDFILSRYNCSSESYSTEDLKVFPFMFMHEAKKNIDSNRFKQSITIMEDHADLSMDVEKQ